MCDSVRLLLFSSSSSFRRSFPLASRWSVCMCAVCLCERPLALPVTFLTSHASVCSVACVAVSPPPITVHLTGYPNIQEWVVRRKTLRVRGPSRIRHDTSGPSRLVYVWYDILYRRVVRYDTPVARCRARTLTNLHVAYVTCICYTTLD
jgi:hypothetical protein